MSITDELRKWARDNTVQGEVITTYPVKHPVHGTLESLVAIADRIDATYEEDVNTACKLANSLSADELAEHGWIRLPVDADGVPIRVGDKINVYQAKNVEVVGVGDQVVFTHYYMGDYHKHFAGDCRHYTPPKVEDVLREFALRVTGKEVGSINHDVVAEYAQKLRLAGDGE